ncbi:MAG: peptidase domain-containing ABC transporter [Bacteroidia bacterium]
MSFPFYKQLDAMDCGPTCLRMIAKYYGVELSLDELKKLSQTTREGSSLLGLSEAAEAVGFRTLGVKISLETFLQEPSVPCIAHWSQNHYVVVYKVRKNKIYVSDPEHGLLDYTNQEFSKFWVSEGKEGILLLLEATPSLREQNGHSAKGEKNKYGFQFLSKYLFRYKKLIFQLFLGLAVGSLIQLAFPLLTQSIVDVGIQHNDVNFIYMVLLAQLMLFLGRTSIDIIRSWILMHISSRINISLVSDFFVKLMKLPISYFDVKVTGDLMQRINDHTRIENFFTSTTLNTIFSLFNLVVFSFVLACYNLKIFLVFLSGSILYLAWILILLNKRAKLDYKRFQQNSRNQSKVVELISGMQEIKLNNAERKMRWQWETIQVKLFKINLKSLSLIQMQNSGSALINELKNIIITCMSAKLVLDGQITLGMMLSISYITGQLNSPIIELIAFIHQWQDAKLSIERLAEIHSKEDEEPAQNSSEPGINKDSILVAREISFKYEGAGAGYVLKDLNISIPSNKITAIVGSSGSGKTTLMKLLLKFYEPTLGAIFLEDKDLKNVSAKAWRERCGVVMQEGYIFSDTIANNIGVAADEFDLAKLKRAASLACIDEFIESLPLKYNTKIGMEGVGISTGQKQRILIARAIYKDPDYLFLDEATSALDSNNEKDIMYNLDSFFKNRTVVIIAHRLSTVKNSDQILVLEKGKVIEQGKHEDLVAAQGKYFNLVKNQLELGN